MFKYFLTLCLGFLSLVSLKAQPIDTTAQKSTIQNNTYTAKNASIWYLGHSGWAVETQNYFLVFDPAYAKPDLNRYQNKKIFVFISHGHGDHYSSRILDWKKDAQNMTYIFGWHPRIKSKIVLSSCKFMNAREKTTISGLQIFTIQSTDAGVGFAVNADGINIYHSGDHGNWGEELNPSFTQEIDFISQNTKSIDIAFVMAVDGGCRKNLDLYAGLFYTIEKLEPTVLFPMHGYGCEKYYREFAKEVKDKMITTKICCATKIGDRFLFLNGRVK